MSGRRRRSRFAAALALAALPALCAAAPAVRSPQASTPILARPAFPEIPTSPLLSALPSASAQRAGPTGEGDRGWADFLNALNQFYRRVLFLPEQASTMARYIDYLHYFEITTMFAVAALLFVVGLYFVVRYRRRYPGQHTPRVVPTTIFELGLYGGLLAFFVLLWLIGFKQYVDLTSLPESDLDVYVSAKQWMWDFSYPGGPASVGVLYVPAGRQVRLHLTSRDVIHSFFVPEFRIKRDAVPGMYTMTWFEAREPGRYPILCAELCGVGHSHMRGEVQVLDAADFDDWLASRPPLSPADVSGEMAPTLEPPSGLRPQSRLAEIGRNVAASAGCLACHSLDGSPGTGPTWLGLYGAWETLNNGERILANDAYLTQSMMEPQAKIVAGYPPDMPSYQGRLAPAEVAAILELMRSLGRGPVLRTPPGTAGGPLASDTISPGPSPRPVPTREPSP